MKLLFDTGRVPKITLAQWKRLEVALPTGRRYIFTNVYLAKRAGISQTRALALMLALDTDGFGTIGWRAYHRCSDTPITPFRPLAKGFLSCPRRCKYCATMLDDDDITYDHAFRVERRIYFTRVKRS